MRINTLLTGLAVLGLTLAAQANTINYTFLENGPGNLGPSSTFNEGGVLLTATASPGQSLFAKNAGGDENGLGILSEADHEISPNTFIQLTVPTVPVSLLRLIFVGSIQSGESAKVYWSPTLGTLGSTLIGSLSGNGSVDISGYNMTGYIGVTAGSGNVLIDGLTADVSVPDGGTTVLLLGGALTALGLIRRKLLA